MAMALAAPRWQRLGDYVQLTKPRIVAQIVLTTWAALYMAQREPLPLGLVAATLLGTALAVGGAHSLNAYRERDVDALMERTRRRPLPQGRLQPWQALLWGLALGGASLAVMLAGVNVLAALLAQVGLWYYVLVYTPMKRWTPLNTFLGGVCGAVPPLIGWAAATGRLEAPAWLLFALMMLWQPAHFHAFTVYRVQDYARAGLPMLPVVRGVELTMVRILLYVIGVVASSLALYTTGLVGRIYLSVVVALGAPYLAMAAAALRRQPEATQGWAKALFGYSNLYLVGVFVAMVADLQP